MFLVNTALSTWLNAEMHSRGWSQSDLARKSGLHRAVISKILSESSKPTPETCQALAAALKIPPEQVFRAAGLLPPRAAADEITERAEHIISAYRYPETKQRALDYLELLRLQEERGEYLVKPTERPAPSEQG